MTVKLDFKYSIKMKHNTTQTRSSVTKNFLYIVLYGQLFLNLATVSEAMVASGKVRCLFST